MSQDESVDGPNGEDRNNTIKKLKREKEVVDTADRDTSNNLLLD